MMGRGGFYKYHKYRLAKAGAICNHKYSAFAACSPLSIILEDFPNIYCDIFLLKNDCDSDKERV